MSDFPIPAPLWRRLAAAVYDCLLLIALWMVVTLFVVIIGSYVGTKLPTRELQALLLLVGWLFFALSWTRGGQTLGMQAWRLKLRRGNGETPGLARATARYFAAMLSWAAAGLGMLWCLIDPQRRAWHDILTDTEVVVLPKPRAGEAAPPP